MALTEKNIRNIFIYAVPRFASYGLNILLLPVFTRILTPHDFGIITLAWAFPAVAVSVFSCTLVSAAQRYYFEYRHDDAKLNAFFFSSQAFLYFSLFVSSIGVFIFKDYISQLFLGSAVYGTAVWIAFIASYLGNIISFYLTLYQNMELAAHYAFFTILQAVISGAASLLLVWFYKMSYMGMLYGSLMGSSIVCVSAVFYFNRGIKIDFDRKILFENLKYGLQITPKSFTSFINRFFDKYMLKNMLSLSAVGVYNIGQTVGNTMFFLMNTVWSSFQPVCYKDVFDKGDEGAKSAGRLFTVFSYITLAPVLLLILFAQEIIFIVAPPSYFGAIDIIIIIAAAVSTQTFGMYVSVQYAYSKKIFWIFPNIIFSAVINVISNIILIPRFGLIGAGAATVVTYFFTNGIGAFVGQKLYRIPYEWKNIGLMYAIIAGATFSVLYLRAVGLNGLYIYSLKMIMIALYLYAGAKAGIITKHSIRKVSVSLFNYPGKSEI